MENTAELTSGTTIAVACIEKNGEVWCRFGIGPIHLLEKQIAEEGDGSKILSLAHMSQVNPDIMSSIVTLQNHAGFRDVAEFFIAAGVVLAGPSALTEHYVVPESMEEHRIRFA